MPHVRIRGGGDQRWSFLLRLISATRRGPRAWVSASITNAFKLTFRFFAVARTRRFNSTGSRPTICIRPFISCLQVWGRAGCPLTHDRSVRGTSRVESWKARVQARRGRRRVDAMPSPLSYRPRHVVGCGARRGDLRAHRRTRERTSRSTTRAPLAGRRAGLRRHRRGSIFGSSTVEVPMSRNVTFSVNVAHSYSTMVDPVSDALGITRHRTRSREN